MKALAGALLVTLLGAGPSGTLGGLRTVIVVDPRHPPRSPVVWDRLCAGSPRCRAGEGGLVVVVRLSGPVPPRPTMATVLSDSDCEPGRDGLSHCRNTLRLDAGGVLTVRHTHRMARVPCLEPGERVRVISWFKT